MQDAAFWDCVTSSDFLKPEAVDVRHQITSTAQGHDWDTLLKLLSSWRGNSSVNSVHLDDPSFDTPLHEAARGGAPEQVVQKLIELKAFRTMRNAQGQRPIDLAHEAGQTHLYSVLEPTLHDVSAQDLPAIERHFHALIREGAERMVGERFSALRLPALEPLLETNIDQIWCPIPGMYGGFRYGLGEGYDKLTVVTDSWSRVIEGSEQTHAIDTNGFRLID